MHRLKTSEAEIPEVGGEPLEGSGFEAQETTTEFDLEERSSVEGVLQ